MATGDRCQSCVHFKHDAPEFVNHPRWYCTALDVWGYKFGPNVTRAEDCEHYQTPRMTKPRGAPKKTATVAVPKETKE